MIVIVSNTKVVNGHLALGTVNVVVGQEETFDEIEKQKRNH